MRKAALYAALTLVACTETDPARLAAPDPSLSSAAIGEVRYVVVFKQPHALPRDVTPLVARAGGTIIQSLPEIGAISVVSSNPGFAAAIAADNSVAEVGEDPDVQLIPERFDVSDLSVSAAEATATPGPTEPAGPDPQPGTEPLYHQQWDKMRMNASATGSYAVQPGRREVTVGILDTGVEITHPDIVPNLDFARSRSFVPTEPDIDDQNGHGSWCASAVGAPVNGIGISGVAPQVTLVALKVLNRQGRGNATGLAAALVYAGQQKLDIASMSLSGIASHSSSQPVVTLIQRAVDFARMNGVTPIAALGNDLYDLSDGDFFRSFIVWPAELPGVIGVSATGYYNRRSYYSNYGMGKTDVSAPGGDLVFQPPPAPYFGRGGVVGAWAPETQGSLSPVQRFEECNPVTGVCSYYAWIQGTSMATPNAAGVAALIISQYGDFTPDGSRKTHMPPTQVEAILQRTANNQPCPEPNAQTYTFRPPPPAAPFSITTTCKGEAGGYTNYFGKGMVDALKAVTGGPGSTAAEF